VWSGYSCSWMKIPFLFGAETVQDKLLLESMNSIESGYLSCIHSFSKQNYLSCASIQVGMCYPSGNPGRDENISFFFFTLRPSVV
jgi:hypothetical protein